MKNIENNPLYTVQKLHLCLFLAEDFQLTLFLQYFQYILQLVYQLIFSWIFNLNSLNTHQHHKIYHIRTHNYEDSKEILYRILYPLSHQSIFCIHTCIYLHSSVVYCYKHLHLVYIYIYKFRTILYASFQ